MADKPTAQDNQDSAQKASKPQGAELTPGTIESLAAQMDDVMEQADLLRELIDAETSLNVANRGRMMVRANIIRDMAEHTKYALIGWP